MHPCRSDRRASGRIGGGLLGRRQHVYVAAELDDAVSVYQRLAGTGALKFRSSAATVSAVNGLGNARGLALSGDGTSTRPPAATTASVSSSATPPRVCSPTRASASTARRSRR
ncbi:MAG: hypothetical protein R2862_00655 [Thermoanaerobaculia bacterium]